MDFIEVLDGVFDEKSEEFETIETVYDLIGKSSPTIAAEMKTHLILLDKYRITLSTMYFMLNRNISKKKETYQSTYDSAYARLVKLGRPSNAAIEAEIRSINPGYSGASFEIEKLEQVKELINSYIRCIDSSKQTITELLRDNRRID